MGAQAHYAAAGMAAACDDFLLRFPAYAATAAIDELRAADYGAPRPPRPHVPRLHGWRVVCGVADQTPPRSLSADGSYGNPHSAQPDVARVDQARATGAGRGQTVLQRVARFEYEVVFTSNASGALKLVGESYPFGPGATYLLSYDTTTR